MWGGAVRAGCWEVGLVLGQERWQKWHVERWKGCCRPRVWSEQRQADGKEPGMYVGWEGSWRGTRLNGRWAGEPGQMRREAGNWARLWNLRWISTAKA